MRLVLATFDQSVTPVFDGPVHQFGSRQLETVLARRPLGASNLEAALTWLGQKGGRRAVVVGDAIPTAGHTDGAGLGAIAARLASSIDRIDFVLSGGIHDAELAKRLAGSSRQAGAVLDGELSEKELARRLSLPTRSGIRVAVRGAKWTWPETLDGLQPGDELLVYALLGSAPKPAARTAVVSLEGSLAQTLEMPLRTAPRPLLERALAGAEIARLSAHRDRLGPQNQLESQRLRQAIVDVSTRHRVLSDLTALLVLETEEDYVRYGIDRRALVDILRVGDAGIEVTTRSPAGRGCGPRPEGLETEGFNASRRWASLPGASSRFRSGCAASSSAEAPLDLTPSQAEDRDEKTDEAYGYEFSGDAPKPVAESRPRPPRPRAARRTLAAQRAATATRTGTRTGRATDARSGCGISGANFRSSAAISRRTRAFDTRARKERRAAPPQRAFRRDRATDSRRRHRGRGRERARVANSSSR